MILNTDDESLNKLADLIKDAHTPSTAEQQDRSGTAAGYIFGGLSEEIEDRLLHILNGYKTIYIGYAMEVVNSQFVYKSQVEAIRDDMASLMLNKMCEAKIDEINSFKKLLKLYGYELSGALEADINNRIKWLECKPKI